MKRYSIYILTLLVENTAMMRWVILCGKFNDFFHSQKETISQNLAFAIHEEQNTSLFIVRFFHNKITESIFWGLKSYLRIVDIQFFVALLSFVGCVGIFLGIWFYLNAKKKSLFITSCFGMFAIVSLIEVFIHPQAFYYLRFFGLVLPLEGISFYGIKKSLTGKHEKIFTGIMLISILISILLLVGYPQDIFVYCIGK